MAVKEVMCERLNMELSGERKRIRPKRRGLDIVGGKKKKKSIMMIYGTVGEAGAIE